LVAPNIIAIDGPVATGKSVVGQLLAQELDYQFLDTGTMYRAIAWLSFKKGLEPEDHEALEALAKTAKIDFSPDSRTVFINDKTVPLMNERSQIDKIVSIISMNPGVRKAMVENQRTIASTGSIVIVGRDIGTVVLPNAPLKLYFEAPLKERASRRYQEMIKQGHNISLFQVIDEISKRDKLDSERKHSPMRPATDAHVINTQGLTVNKVVSLIMNRIRLMA
jgi:cytidylate kinase